jgi:hypothetical protein
MALWEAKRGSGRIVVGSERIRKRKSGKSTRAAESESLDRAACLEEISMRDFRHVADREHLTGWAIDGNGRAVEDGGMSEVTSATPRRSGRVFHKIRMQAQGKAHNGKKFREVCETVVVNAHGGLLLLKHEVNNGEMLVLTNPETLEEQECRVVYLGDPGDRGQRVGIEFLTPAPRFWGVEFVEGSPENGVH